jgi:hypothetical protein
MTEPELVLRESETGTVLLAWYDPCMAHLITKVLSPLRVLWAKTGEEAVNLFQQRQAEIDLVMLNRTLRAMATPEVIDALLRISPTVPLTVMADLCDPEGLEKYLTEERCRQVWWWFGKPWRLEVFLESVRQLVEASQTHIGVPWHGKNLLMYMTSERFDPDMSPSDIANYVTWSDEQKPSDQSNAICFDPIEVRNYFWRGWGHYPELGYSRVIEQTSDAIRLNPNDLNAYHWRGRAYYWRRKYHKAVWDLSSAISLSLTAGFCFLEGGSYKWGLTADSYFLRGRSYEELWEYAKAIADYSELLQLLQLTYESEACVVLLCRGIAYVCNHDYTKGLEDCSEAIRRCQCEHANRIYASLLATCPEERLRNGDKAIEYGTAACELTEWVDGTCLEALAAAYAESGDFRTAVKWQEDAITRNCFDDAPQRLSLYQGGKPYRQGCGNPLLTVPEPMDMM